MTMTLPDTARPTIPGEPSAREQTALRVRAATPDDADGLLAILDSPHVLDGTMRIPHSDAASTLESLRPSTNQRVLVAVDPDERIVGLLVLVTHLEAPRFHHVAHIDLVATHPDHQGRGAASSLITTVIEMAEQWMAVERLELIVFTGNVGAIRLYEHLGFEIEGTMRSYAFARGRFVDAHVMARFTSASAGGR
jgi:putative acetyltransferase